MECLVLTLEDSNKITIVKKITIVGITVESHLISF